MFKNYKVISVLLFSFILLSACSKELEKIRVTTSSPEARELYLKGFSLTERLRGFEAYSYFEDAIALDSNFAMAYLGLAVSQQYPNKFFQFIQKAV